LLIGAAGALIWSRWPRQPAPWHAALALVAAAALLTVITGRSRWVAMNGHAPRYLLPALLLIQTALCAMVLGAIRGKAGQNCVTLGMSVVLVLSVAGNYGAPSLTIVRACLDQRLGRHTEVVLAADCTHVGGDYWQTWTTVFHVNLTLRDRGDARQVWGVAYRGRATMQRWRSAAPRLAMLGHDERAEALLREGFPPLTTTCYGGLEVRVLDWRASSRPLCPLSVRAAHDGFDRLRSEIHAGCGNPSRRQ
jgi:hypothetical protein